MGSNENILDIHREYNFPLDILREYIYENANIAVSDFKKITDGVDNEVYEIGSEVYDIGRYMVKIRRDGDVPFSCVKWAVEKCREQSVKVPEIIYCGKISDSAQTLDIIIEEKIHGHPLTPDLYREAGAELRKIHSVKVHGYWRMHEDGRFDFDINGVLQDGSGSIFDDNKDMSKIPVLCHGDYRPDHILCGEHINGIIDFGEFHGGDGYYDIVDFLRCSDEQYFDRFISGYGEINIKELLQRVVETLTDDTAEARKSGDEDEAKNLERKLHHIMKMQGDYHG